MQKILIIQTAFIGDVVLATAMVEKLYDYYPSAQIDILVRKGNEKLLLNHPKISTTLIWDKKNKKLPNLFKLLKTIRKIKYDKVINLQRFLATGILTAFSNATEKIGFDKNPLSYLFTKVIPHRIDAGIHEVERNNDLIKSFTDDKITRPKLYPSQQDFEKVAIYKGSSFITITPSSVWFTKQYPMEKWIEFMNSIGDRLQVYILGGPENVDDCNYICKHSNHKETLVLAGQLGFLQSAALMKDAVMNYTNDSAPLHFASAVDAPVTGVFCSTVPSFGFTPLSTISYIVETRETLACRPCGLHGYKKCPLGHFKCALTISNDDLLNKLPVHE